MNRRSFFARAVAGIAGLLGWKSAPDPWTSHRDFQVLRTGPLLIRLPAFVGIGGPVVNILNFGPEAVIVEGWGKLWPGQNRRYAHKADCKCRGCRKPPFIDVTPCQ